MKLFTHAGIEVNPCYKNVCYLKASLAEIVLVTQTRELRNVLSLLIYRGARAVTAGTLCLSKREPHICYAKLVTVRMQQARLSPR